ncbi:M48 family metalloprotease [Halopiger goleimassiliensis]|uniref:M48 family metalloprotease n=1 Tax=Halopiger goleimassiliensis TaxID=1293048 RepID=UPI0006780388|nr:M48 family metalloprotease [Halopiger goleimassiliensis]
MTNTPESDLETDPPASELDRLGSRIESDLGPASSPFNPVAEGSDRLAVEIAAETDVREVFRMIEAEPDVTGTIAVVRFGGHAQWTITCENGDIVSVEYETDDHWRPRRTVDVWFADSLVFVGIGVVLVGLLTAVLGVAVPTPMSGSNALLAVGLGGVLLLAGVLLRILRALLGWHRSNLQLWTNKRYDVVPGEYVPAFDGLPPRDRAVVVSIETAKERVNDLLAVPPAIESLVATSVFAYLLVVAYLAVGPLAVVLIGLFPFVSFVLSVVVIPRYLVSITSAPESNQLYHFLDELHEGDGDQPLVRLIGNADDPIDEHLPAAYPWENLVVLPRRIVETFEPAELKAVLAHEYAHLRHHPVEWHAIAVGTAFVLPGLALLVTPVAPTAAQLWAGLVGYLLAVEVGNRFVCRRWDRTADAFAAERTSPIAAATAILRLTDRPVLDWPLTDHDTWIDQRTVPEAHSAPGHRFVRLVRLASNSDET